MIWYKYFVILYNNNNTKCYRNVFISYATHKMHVSIILNYYYVKHFCFYNRLAKIALCPKCLYERNTLKSTRNWILHYCITHYIPSIAPIRADKISHGSCVTNLEGYTIHRIDIT